MEKSITELKLNELEAVVGGVDMAVTATVNRVPPGTSTKLPKTPHPAPPSRKSLI